LLNTNPMILDFRGSRRVTAGSQFPREVTEVTIQRMEHVGIVIG